MLNRWLIRNLSLSPAVQINVPLSKSIGLDVGITQNIYFNTDYYLPPGWSNSTDFNVRAYLRENSFLKGSAFEYSFVDFTGHLGKLSSFHEGSVIGVEDQYRLSFGNKFKM